MSAVTETPPVAVQIGAGKIGRGLMGELFFASGYRTIFVDINRPLVEALRARTSYEVHHVTNSGDRPVRVAGFSALHADDAEAVAEAVAGATLVCTAVGARNLPDVAPSIARGLARRIRRGVAAPLAASRNLVRGGSPDPPRTSRPRGGTARRVRRPAALGLGIAAPLNVIACENLLDSGRVLADRVWAAFAALDGPHLARADFEACFGFVGAVVSRTVPVPPAEIRRRDPLWLACEPVAHLLIDAAACRGPVPPVTDVEPVANFAAYLRQKLVSHNMGHAVAAYLGYPAGHEFIWQAMDDAAIEAVVRGAMRETGRALCSRYGFTPARQRAFEDDLLERFRNRAIGDQVRRVAADPLRKLGPEDRLIGAARLCLEEKVEPANLLVGIRAALEYNNPGDPGAVQLQEMLASRGREAVLRDVCGLSPDEPLFARLRE